MLETLPILFVGSSSESARHIGKIKEHLKGTVVSNLWNKDVFDPALGNYLTDLIQGIESSNCALFIFAADDKRIKRGKKDLVTRDNVIFEAGIAIGLLGKQRVFIIAEQGTSLPSDLEGLSIYIIRPDMNGSYEKSISQEMRRFKRKLTTTREQLLKSPVYLNEYVLDKIKEGVLTAREIWAISPLLSSFIENHEADLINRLNDSVNPLNKFIAVLRDPYGHTINLIASHHSKYSDPQTIYKKISASIDTLQKLKHKYKDKIVIYVLDHPFICSSYVFDPETENCRICVQYNPFGEVERLPQLLVPVTRLFWSDFYLKQANEYLQHAKPYPAHYTSIVLKGSCDFSEKNSLLSLWEQGYETIGFRGKKSALEKLRPNTLVVLAQNENKLVGFSLVDKATGKRRATVVEKSFRNKDVATDMIRMSLDDVPNQYSEVHQHSKEMQRVLLKNGFVKINTAAEIKSTLKRSDITYRYDKRNDILKYKRGTSKGIESGWLILYKRKP